MAVVVGVGAEIFAPTMAGSPSEVHWELHHNDAPASPAPTTGTTPLPTGLVGTDPRPTKGRTNSGPLAPDNGGTGDAGKDFGTLTGGKSGPAPSGSTYPPGTQVGENGTALRPATGKSS